ncbi:TetR/AcrR family transcriptional regulator [Rhodococcus sp. JVH1]|uniref:TetR/AcrR family transcriptional regulator n=1 Tax=Rhodococcus sp. JVH1 TaxID=745408 RepID=UPI00027203AB|nr:TetR/AcrR family transcriptional regulator [Rhodococcus sp. JVH1]EJI95937.1 transcriptional regulator, TetR family [Rhodococcus sp. JVH1]
MGTARATNSRKAGRPRDDTVESAVLEAALTILATEGVAGMSMNSVAAAAGVSKVTMYSRWASKSDLIGAALGYLQLGHIPETTGDVRADLVAMLQAMRRQYDAVGGMSILGSCLTDEPRSGKLLEIVRKRTVMPRRAAFLDVIHAGIASGYLRNDVDPDSAVSALIGLFYADYIAGVNMPDDWDESAVDLVLRGLIA